MKNTFNVIVAATALFCSAASAQANEQKYLLSVDTHADCKVPSIKLDAKTSKLKLIQIDIKGECSKYVLTPTTETRYGAFGEKVVTLTEVVPLP